MITNTVALFVYICNYINNIKGSEPFTAVAHIKKTMQVLQSQWFQGFLRDFSVIEHDNFTQKFKQN